MIGLPRSVKILLFSQPTDMRKGFCGLSYLVEAANQDVYSGHLFVFVSKRRDRAKILTFQNGGFVLWYKLLEKGRFRPLCPNDSSHVELDATELTMLLDGIDIKKVRKPRLWEPRQTSLDNQPHSSA